MSWLRKKIAEKANQNRAESHGATYDKEKQTVNLPSHYHKKQAAYNKGRNKAIEEQGFQAGYNSIAKPQTQANSNRAQRAKNSATAGLNFLSGTGMGFDIGGGQSQDAIMNLLDFGGNGSKATGQTKLKPKRTTINTGNKRITITENPTGEMMTPKRKSGNNVFENLEKLMDEELPW